MLSEASKPVGKLYHFIEAEKLALALRANRLAPHSGKLPMNVPKNVLHYVSDSGESVFYGISTTRNPRWKPNETRKDGYWAPIRVTLDGTKLSQKYKIISYNDFWKFGDVSRKLKDSFYNQQEEKILTKSEGIKDWLKYVLSIEVLASEQDLAKEGFKHTFEAYGLGEKLTKAGIEWRYVKDFSGTAPSAREKVAAKYFVAGAPSRN